MLDTFSVFIVIPKKGLHRLAVHDISEDGMSFNIEIEGELPSNSQTQEGESLDFRLYLNATLYIPLSIQVVRVSEHHDGKRIGAEFQDKESANYRAFLSLLHLLDNIESVLRVDSTEQTT
jgi:hypothetical protein